MESRIEALKQLIDEQLAIVTDNPVEEQYKSRTISNYCTALKTLMEINRKE